MALGEAWLVTVTAGGEVHVGVRVPDETVGRPTLWRLGPDGIAYGITGEDRWLAAFDAHGIRRGWPVKVAGIETGAGGGSVSNPAFGPQGWIYLMVDLVGPDAVSTVIMDANGRTVMREPLPLTADDFAGWALTDDPPIVADDGTIFVIQTDAVYHMDASARPIKGWPFRHEAGFDLRPGYCSPDEPFGCDFPFVAPVLCPGDVVHLMLGSEADPSRGGGVTAVDSNGRVRTGWPVTLRRPGSEFWSVASGPDGTTYALAVEPEAGTRYSATILAIAPDSTVRYRTTIVQP